MKRDPDALTGREHDVLVIGGGIAGAWTVWEAASRGLRAALVEMDDFGQATSWSSLKTAHGGLRHLQRFDLAGFRESVAERRALLMVAPEIVRPLRFAVPSRGLIDGVKYTAGGILNDFLARNANRDLREDRHIGETALLSARDAPEGVLDALGSTAAFLWWDAQITHTERLLMGLLHAAGAATEPAALLNRARLERVSPVEGGFELEIRDLVADTPLRVRARSVVNAAGAGVEAVARLFDDTCGEPPLLRGVNVVLKRDPTPGLAVGEKDRGKFLFLVPWLGQSMLGTAYDSGEGPVDALVDGLIEAARRAFPWAALTRDDVAAVHCGHVPALPDRSEPVYRSSLILGDNPRFFSVLSAKYTTARASAEEAIDQVGKALGETLPPSISATTLLPAARPMAGDFEARVREALDLEMAPDRPSAVRGRLIEGAQGLTKPLDGA